MKSDSIFKSGDALKVAIIVGKIDVVELYTTLVNDMLAFLDKFIWVCQKIGIQI